MVVSGRLLAIGLLAWGAVFPGPAQALDPRAMESVVSVLPLWHGYGRGGQPGQPPGLEPEGTAVAIRDGGYLITANHIVDRAEDIQVRLSDGRLAPAQLVGQDALTDLAVLRIDESLPLLEIGPEPPLGAPVCTIGNQFGLGLSVTCGVVSAVRRNGVGFNPIEDFIQTDAVVNPGASGGALIDGEGRLVGVLLAIFTKDSDADIGINFAASSALVLRVADDLIDQGRVRRSPPGVSLGELSQSQRRTLSGVRVLAVTAGGPAALAGLQSGDVILAIDGRPVDKVSAALAAFHLRRPGDQLVVQVLRDGKMGRMSLTLP